MPRRAPFWPVCLLLGGLACGDADVILLLPDASADSSSYVLWANGAIEASDGEPLYPRVETDRARIDLVLLGYTQSLAELELAAGPVSTGMSCRPCDLLAPAARWAARIEDAEVVSDWQRLDELPPEVRTDLVPDAARCDRCRAFEKVQVLADFPPIETTRASFIVHRDEGDLIAYDDGTVRWAHPDHPASPDAHAPDACVRTDDFIPSTGYFAVDDLVWVVDTRNRLLRFEIDRLEPDQPCANAATLTSSIAWEGPTLRKIAGPASAEPEELFGVGLDPISADTIVTRFTLDGKTERIGVLPGPENETGVAWSGLGEAIAVNGDKRMMRIEGGQPRLERMEIDGADFFISSVDYIPGRGYLFGTSVSGAAFEEAMGKYRFLQDDPGVHQRVDRIIAYHGGLVVGERTGAVTRFFDNSGYCDSARVFYEQTSDFMAVSFRGALIGGLTKLYYAIPPEDQCAP